MTNLKGGILSLKIILSILSLEISISIIAIAIIATKFNLSNSDIAAWVQAIGSIIALSTAFLSISYDHYKSKEERQQQEIKAKEKLTSYISSFANQATYVATSISSSQDRLFPESKISSQEPKSQLSDISYLGKAFAVSPLLKIHITANEYTLSQLYKASIDSLISLKANPGIFFIIYSIQTQIIDIKQDLSTLENISTQAPSKTLREQVERHFRYINQSVLSTKSYSQWLIDSLKNMK